jgi:hypothetical protein
VRDTPLTRIPAVFHEALVRHLSFLPEWAYSAPAIDHDDGLLPSLRARLRSDSRELVFALVVDHSKLPNAPNRHVMTAHLYRNEGRDEDDRLSIDWFAAVHRRDLSARLERAADQGGPIDGFVETVLPIYRALFVEDMRALLTGTAWESGTGDPRVVRTFAFLERDFGFEPPVGRRSGHDVTHTYTRGHVSVNVTDDGGPHEVMSIAVGERPMQFIWRTPPEAVIAILKAHPEIFEGDFASLAGIAVSG